jgi:hypothetical protein
VIDLRKRGGGGPSSCLFPGISGCAGHSCDIFMRYSAASQRYGQESPMDFWLMALIIVPALITL